MKIIMMLLLRVVVLGGEKMGKLGEFCFYLF